MAAAIAIVLDGNSDAALGRVAEWGDGWYGFDLARVTEAAERIAFLGDQCAQRGSDRSELRVTVAVRELHISDLVALADLGVDGTGSSSPSRRRKRFPAGRRRLGVRELASEHCADVGALDDVIEAGEHEIVINIPLQFAFQDFVHDLWLPPVVGA